MKIPKRVREEAALILAICASQAEPGGINHVFMQDVADMQDERAWNLAGKALTLPDGQLDPVGWREAYAEAEARLRTGWSPS